MTDNQLVARLAAICPTSHFRAKHALDISYAELDAVIRSAGNRFKVDFAGISLAANAQPSDPPSDPADDSWRCGWTIPNEDRHASR